MLKHAALMLLVGCTSIDLPEPPGAPAGGKADEATESVLTCSYANRSIPALTPRFAELAATELAGLRKIDGVPFPTIGHDADGFFHPKRRVVHSSSLRADREVLGDYLDELGFDGSAARSGQAVGIPTPYLEGGTFSTGTPVPHDSATTLRLGVWNIARGAELDTVIGELKRMDADFWIINEGDFYGRSAGGRAAAREIAKALGWYYVASGEFYELRDDRRGLSGNALVSRYPLSDVKTIYVPLFGGRDWAERNPLDPQPRCGQRSALSARATVTLASGSTQLIHLISAHLENGALSTTRTDQLRVVRELLAVPGEPTVIGGDFNTLGVGEGAWLRDDLANGRHAPYELADCSAGDDTATFGISRIDWILAQGGGALSCSGYRVGREAVGSDHKPVLTELTLR